MSKNNFLLVDLNDTKTKKLAETITSETSRKILSYLAEKDETEANIAQVLEIPISTVHYHLQKLQEAGLVKVEEFHYSQKGREVNHYKLANKYIIIAPQKVSGLREKLKGILPVGLIILGVAGIIKLITSWTTSLKTMAATSSPAADAAESTLLKAAPIAIDGPIGGTPYFPWDYIALWFLIGGIAAIIIYLIILLIKEWWRKKHE
ncbi:MAG: helix-turn-helix domain-containing protein [Candidatus Woesearchaeota archaeon]